MRTFLEHRLDKVRSRLHQGYETLDALQRRRRGNVQAKLAKMRDQLEPLGQKLPPRVQEWISLLWPVDFGPKATTQAKIIGKPSARRQHPASTATDDALSVSSPAFEEPKTTQVRATPRTPVKQRGVSQRPSARAKTPAQGVARTASEEAALEGFASGQSESEQPTTVSGKLRSSSSTRTGESALGKRTTNTPKAAARRRRPPETEKN